MDMFGVSWPQEMDCDRLAQQDGGTKKGKKKTSSPLPPLSSFTSSAGAPVASSTTGVVMQVWGVLGRHEAILRANGRVFT